MVRVSKLWYAHCRCMVTYMPKEGGRIQDVYSKKWCEDEVAKKKRIEYSNVQMISWEEEKDLI